MSSDQVTITLTWPPMLAGAVIGGQFLAVAYLTAQINAARREATAQSRPAQCPEHPDPGHRQARGGSMIRLPLKVTLLVAALITTAASITSAVVLFQTRIMDKGSSAQIVSGSERVSSC